MHPPIKSPARNQSNVAILFFPFCRLFHREALDASALLQQMIASAIEREGAGETGDEIRTAIALALARSSAIVYGQLLTAAEMDELVTSLFASSAPNHTPDGQTVLSVITMDEIEKRF